MPREGIAHLLCYPSLCNAKYKIKRLGQGHKSSNLASKSRGESDGEQACAAAGGNEEQESDFRIGWSLLDAGQALGSLLAVLVHLGEFRLVLDVLGGVPVIDGFIRL